MAPVGEPRTHKSLALNHKDPKQMSTQKLCEHALGELPRGGFEIGLRLQGEGLQVVRSRCDGESNAQQNGKSNGN